MRTKTLSCAVILALFPVLCVAETEACAKQSSLQLVQKAAKQGNAKAEDCLGDVYFYADLPRHAIYWFNKSADQGYALGELDLGLIIGSQNCNRSHYWIRKAVEQGSGIAEMQLALDYLNGTDCLPKSRIKAAYWTQRAANQGNVEAKKFLRGLAPSS